MVSSLLAISVGASAGAVLRWVLGTTLNAIYPAIPPGTWLANMLGGYLIGISLGFFAQHAGLAPEWRLLVITGFLGRVDHVFHLFSRSSCAAPARALVLGRVGHIRACRRVIGNDAAGLGIGFPSFQNVLI